MSYDVRHIPSDRMLRRIDRLSVIGANPTAENLNFYIGCASKAIIFGEWEKDEISFLLENKKNAISAINSKNNSSTAVYCPKERLDELVEILKVCVIWQ